MHMVPPPNEVLTIFVVGRVLERRLEVKSLSYT